MAYHVTVRLTEREAKALMGAAKWLNDTGHRFTDPVDQRAFERAVVKLGNAMEVTRDRKVG